MLVLQRVRESRYIPLGFNGLVRKWNSLPLLPRLPVRSQRHLQHSAIDWNTNDSTPSRDMDQNDYNPGTNPQGTNLPWYDATPKSIDPSTRTLLETYSGIAPEKVEEHIIDIVISVHFQHLPLSNDSTAQSSLQTILLPLPWPIPFP